MPRLYLSDTADAAIRRHARTRRLVETGGPLFGYVDDRSGDVVVAIAYGPGPGARHRPRSLRPDRAATQAAIREVHERSRGALSYIGDWHTHPGGAARPSGWDLRSLAAIASEQDVDLPEPVALIVSTVVLSRHVRVRDPGAFKWATDSQTTGVEQLEVVFSSDVGPG